MNDNLVSSLYYLASVCFYIAAILHFFDSGTSSGVVQLCLGSTFLCLGSVVRMKGRKTEDENSKEKK